MSAWVLVFYLYGIPFFAMGAYEQGECIAHLMVHRAQTTEVQAQCVERETVQDFFTPSPGRDRGLPV